MVKENVKHNDYYRFLDVPTCSGCKTFFRRTVISDKHEICYDGGHCDILGGSRCRACRFDRCILYGMNPSGLKLPENLPLGTVVGKMNRRKREPLATGYYQSVEDSSYGLSVVSKRNPTFQLVYEHRDIDFLLFLEKKMVKLRESDYDHTDNYSKSISIILERETILKESGKYKKPSHWPMMINYSRPCAFSPELKGRNWFVTDLILCIEMAKIIPVYEKLIPSDREAAVRNSLLMSSVLTQSYYSNLMHSDTVVAPDGSMPIKYVGNARTHLHEEVFCRVIEPFRRINLTPEEYVLLKAIILCNPAAKNLSDKGRKMLEKESHRYGKLLLKHMQDNLGSGPGALKYANAMQMFESMAYFAQKVRELCVWMMVTFGDICNHSEKFKIANEIMN